MLSSLRSGKASGPVQMGVGLILFGLAGYAFVALTGHTLSSSEANLAIAFYFVVNVVGPGIYYALEQVTSRAASAALASGQPLGPALAKVRKAGIGLVVAVTVILLALSPILVGSTLHGDWLLFAEILLTPLIWAALHMTRGLLGGRQRFGAYAITLAVEGIARLLITGGLAVLGTSQAWVYGAGYLGASVIAALVGFARLRNAGEPAAESVVAGQSAVAKGLAALAVASLLAQLLPNLAPLAVTSRLAQDSAIALAFGQAVVIARIPQLLFFPIQTMLLPALSAAVARREFHVVRRRIKLTLGAVFAAGAVCSLLFVLLGSWVLKTFMGATADLDMPIMLLLAVSTVVLIGAYAVQPALVALGKDHVITVGWALGSVVMLGMVLLLPGDVITVAAAAQVAGPALTLAVVLFGLRGGLRAPAEPVSAGGRESLAPADTELGQ
jgi:O-antigen/teichoic acid export membrane protein